VIELERRLQARYPHWFRGTSARLARPLVRGIRRLSRLDAMEAFMRCHAGLKGLWWVAAALEFLQARYELPAGGLDRIPTEGGLLVVANHPCGALDALALLDALGQVRRDVRIIANDWLTGIEGLRELMLPVRVLGGAAARRDVRAIHAALDAGHCVVVFPAGEVSRLGLQGVRDRPWDSGFARLARRCGVPVLPVRIEARNSALFYGASMLFKPAGTALLAREMFARRNKSIRLFVGAPMQLAACGDARVASAVVRAALALIATQPATVDIAPPGTPAVKPADAQEALIDAIVPALLRHDIDTMLLLGETADGKQIRVGRLPPGSPLMRELGRLRELSFRAVGEGTGRALDVDVYDDWYEQIVLWDAAEQSVVGGYRVARAGAVLRERGLAGLYSASLFTYEVSALPRLAQSLELGRSFVVPWHWGSRSIDYLWQGIGAYLARGPAVRYLCGPVSISAELPAQAREQIVAFYARWYGGDAGVRARTPFQAPRCVDDAPDAASAFRNLRARLDDFNVAVPMLYKQYTELCEPGGARFLAFGVDPGFSGVVDGLVEVDISRLQRRKYERYLAPHLRAVAA